MVAATMSRRIEGAAAVEARVARTSVMCPSVLFCNALAASTTMARNRLGRINRRDRAGRKLRSDVTKLGLTRTPHRAFMRAMALDDAAIERPLVGVVSMKGEQTPCNMTHGF